MRIFNCRDTEESSAEVESSFVEKELNEVDSSSSDPSCSGSSSQEGLMLTKRHWDSGKFWDLLQELHQLSWIQNTVHGLDDRDARFSLHPLIGDWLQLRVESNIRRSCILEAGNLLMIVFNSYNDAGLSRLQRKLEILAHIDACLNNDQQYSGTCNILKYDSLNGPPFAFSKFYHSQGR